MSLTDDDASIVLGMIARGDKKHDIAAWFGENQARVAEVEDGGFGSVSAASSERLPPKGAPGPKGRRLRAFVKKALVALEKGDTVGAEKALTEGAKHFDSSS